MQIFDGGSRADRAQLAEDKVNSNGDRWQRD
jgi:hypothetical protein